MFSYLNGTIAEMGQNSIVVDVGGVGFFCTVSLNTLAKLKVGSVSKIYTHLNVREDAMDLFGFCDKDELECFRLLTSISGVGPKVAVSILSAVTPSSLALAVSTDDDKPILAASGVGKKLAGRIILELKDKIAKSSIELSGFAGAGVTSKPMTSAADSEAYEALIALGYNREEISMALKGAETSAMSTEDIIKLALARLMR